MFPELLRVGPFPIHTYGLMVAIGILAGAWLGELLHRRLGGDPGRYLDLALVTVLGGLLGARLLFILVNLPWYVAHPAEVVMIWKGGLVFYGGFLLGPVAYLLTTRAFRMPVLATGDIAVISLALGHAFGRLGCFAAGCCYGAPWDPPFCVTFTDPDALAPLNVPLFPSQLFSFASGAVIFAILVAYRPRRRSPGQVFWLYLILASAARIAEDAFRGAEAKSAVLPWLSATQAISLGLGAVALLMFVVFGRRSGRLTLPG
jgi:phosphatidylglycerol:prolipoprotein diacylglycerol transferase